MKWVQFIGNWLRWANEDGESCTQYGVIAGSRSQYKEALEFGMIFLAMFGIVELVICAKS